MDYARRYPTDTPFQALEPIDLSTLDTTYLKLDQTTPQTTVGTFTFPAVNVNGNIIQTALNGNNFLSYQTDPLSAGDWFPVVIQSAGHSNPSCAFQTNSGADYMIFGCRYDGMGGSGFLQSGHVFRIEQGGGGLGNMVAGSVGIGDPVSSILSSSESPYSSYFTTAYSNIVPGSISGTEDIYGNPIYDDSSGSIYDANTYALLAYIDYTTGVVTDASGGTDIIDTFNYQYYVYQSPTHIDRSGNINTSRIDLNGGYTSNEFSIFRSNELPNQYYEMRLGSDGSTKQFVFGGGSNPGLAVYDYVNNCFFQVGGAMDYGPYLNAGFRVYNGGCALYDAVGGKIKLTGGVFSTQNNTLDDGSGGISVVSLKTTGKITGAIIQKTSNYSIAPTDALVVMGSNGATVTLPPASSSTGRIITVKTASYAGGANTLASAGGTIDGSTTVSLVVGKSRTVQSDGTYWHVIGGVF